jgi:hypothetical protein
MPPLPPDQTIRVPELPPAVTPAGEDLLHVVDMSEGVAGVDKHATVGSVVALTRQGMATAAQGALANTALQPGSVDLGYTAVTRTITNTGGDNTVLPLVGDALAGLAPASGGGTANFLRADGTWVAPPGGGGGGVGTVTAVSGTAPIAVATGTTTPVVSIAAATTGAPGSMSAADKLKLDGVAANATANVGTVTSTTGTAPIQVATGTSTPVVSITAATTAAAGSMSGADKTKLDGVAPGATANSADAQLRDRSTHTGTQTAATISDFTASSRAQTEAMLTAGTNVTLTPSGTGATRSIQISATAGGGGVSVVTGTAPIVSSGGGSPAISITPASGVTAGSMSSADFTKLAGIAAGATANSPDATLLARANHTGTQLAATISDFTASSRAQVEATLVAGANITLTPSGSGATRTIAIASTAAGGGGGTVTQVDGGAGLTGSVTTTGALAVGAGTGITVAADSVSVDRTVVDTWYATAAQGTLAGTAVQSVVGTAPITATGTTTRTVGINAASGSNPGSMSSADFTKLGGIATGATANDTDANLKNRANHTGTQAGSTITGPYTGAGLTLATARILGRTSASTGAVEEITIGAGLLLSAGSLIATGGGGSSDGPPIHIDASEFIPRTTNGCGIDSQETATNRINRDLLTFDSAAAEFAQAWFPWPAGWATAKVTYYWNLTSATGACVWSARIRVFTSGDANDSAFGTAVTVTDTVSSANSCSQSAASAAITPSGTVTAGKLACLEISRDATNGSDTLAVDAFLQGVLVERAS